MTGANDDFANVEAFELEKLGTPVLHGSGDKVSETIEAMTDLQMVIEGCVSLISAGGKGDVVETLARHCSIFLRKTALGDSRNPRLLDNETCREAGLFLGRINKPPSQIETLEAASLMVKESTTRLTHTHSETSKVTDRSFHAGPWSFSVKVDWPLPGVLDWPSHLTPDSRLSFDPCAMFGDRDLPSCDQWAGQQLLICDGIAVSLADVIRSTVNTDGAHAPVTFPSDPFHGGRQPSAKRSKDDAMLILRGIQVCAFRYMHLITVFAGLYLYLALINSKIGEGLNRMVGIPTFEFSLSDMPDLDRCTVFFDAHIPMPITGSGNIVHAIRNVS
ncbi:MAG: hypothetical protein OXI91_13135 [Chloroflexota bacterium]|nr:hypothetical protein [Chloroflexota bacterium]